MPVTIGIKWGQQSDCNMGYSLFLLSSKDSVSCDDSDDDDEGLSWIQLNFTSLVPRKNNVIIKCTQASGTNIGTETAYKAITQYFC